MNLHTLLSLVDYSSWATDKILTACRGLSLEEFVAVHPGFGHNSLRDTLVHMLSAVWIWRTRIQEGVSPTSSLDPLQYPTIHSVSDAWSLERVRMRDFVLGLVDSDLNRLIQYHSTKGIAYADPMWLLLMHLFNHGTQHRSEAAVILTRLNRSPGDLDLIIYFRSLT